MKLKSLASAAALLALASSAFSATGKVDLKSAGAIAFGPGGVLFIGDSLAGAVFAVETGDKTPGTAPVSLDIKGINEKVAAVLGAAAADVRINDVEVNPISKNVYLAVSRGSGPDAIPVILKVDGAGKISQLALDNATYSSVALPNPPSAAPAGRGGNPRMNTITDMAFLKGNLVVAGLSNEEFASDLRSIPYPFQNADRGASVEIYHGSHGRYETQAPVRTFIPYSINGQDYILAAYTCTPLVTIPVSELKAGSKVKGNTIAELGAGNNPLDMIAYKKDGHDYILLANSARGVMKLSADKLDSYKSITAQTDMTGVPYQTIADLKGVTQLTKVDESTALIVSGQAGAMDLKTIALP